MAAHPPLTATQASLLDALETRVQQRLANTDTISQVTKATVVSVAAGGAADGQALCVVSWMGADIPAPYLAAYTPSVGHVVAVARTGAQLLILGRIVGTP